MSSRLAVICALVLLASLGSLAWSALAEDRDNASPQIKAVVLPDGEQDWYYSFNMTATDVDNSPEELTWSDDSSLFDITQDGEIAFVPRNDDVGFNYFNITVEDPGGLSDTLELMLFIANVNDPPILNYIPPQTAHEGHVFTLDVRQYVEDPDLLLPPEFRDRITYRDDTPKLDTNIETGVLTWDTPSNDDVGDFYLKITIQDSKGRYDEQEIKITVVNTNNPPIIGIISRQVLHQDSRYSFNVPFEDEDLDVHNFVEVLTFTNDQTELFVIDEATGRIQFTPENKHVGTWEVNITVTDLVGASDSRQVVFDVINENDPPNLEYFRVQELVEDQPYQLQVVADDPDLDARLIDGTVVDPDETLEFRTNSTLVPIDRYTGLISFTPTNEYALMGSIMVRLTVVDSSSETATRDILFNIEGVNDPPVILQVTGIVDGQSVQMGTNIILLGQVEDVDNTKDDLLLMWYEGDVLIGQGTSIIWQPEDPGETMIRLVVRDPDGAEAEHVITVTVYAVNLPPFDLEILGLDEGQTVRTDETYPLMGSAKDDSDDKEDLTYTWYLGETQIGTSRVFDWTPEGEGPIQLALVVMDSEGGEDDTSILVVIAKIPPLPDIVHPLPEAVFDDDEKLEISLNISESELDPEKDYEVSVSSNVTGHIKTITPEDELEIDVGTLPKGDHRITVTISDGSNEASTHVDITIKEPTTKEGSPGQGALLTLIGMLSMAIVLTMGPRSMRRS